MATSFSLTSEVRVFPCPNCRETINTSMAQCPFCNTAIDHAAAESAALATSKISQAVSDASYIKILAAMGAGFCFLRFTRFNMFVGFISCLFLFMLAVRWRSRFGSIETEDEDFPGAKKTTLAVGTISICFAAVLLTCLMGLITIRP